MFSKSMLNFHCFISPTVSSTVCLGLKSESGHREGVGGQSGTGQDLRQPWQLALFARKLPGCCSCPRAGISH